MVASLRSVKIATLLIALVAAGLVVKLLAMGSYCRVLGTSLKPGETASAETAIHGVVVYQETGTDHQRIYDAAVWWYEMTLLGEGLIALLVGTAVYAGLSIKLGGRRLP